MYSMGILSLSPKFQESCSPFSFSQTEPFSPLPLLLKNWEGRAEESFFVKSKATLESSLIGCWKCSTETCFCQWKTLFVTIRIACSTSFDPGRTLIYASTSNIAKVVTRLRKKKEEERRKGKESADVWCPADDTEFLMHWSSKTRLQTEECRCHTPAKN